MAALEDLRARGHRADLKTLQGVLLETLKGFSSVYVILDALDECPDLGGGREQLLKCLTSVYESTPTNLHMFWTSRREENIKSSYYCIESNSERWDIDLSAYKPAIDYDIGLFVDSTLALPTYNSWPKGLKEEARKELIKKSDGM